MWVGSSQCRRLYNLDKSLRFAIAHLQGQGLSIAVVQLIEPGDVFNPDPAKRKSLSFTWDQVQGRMHIQGPDGREERKVGGRIPVVVAWPSQAWGLKGVMSGDYMDAAIYQMRSTEAYEADRREAVRQSGRALDEKVRQDGEEMTSYHRYLGREGTGSDYLYDKAHISAELKKSYTLPYLRTLENDKTATFEHEALVDAGFAT